MTILRTIDLEWDDFVWFCYICTSCRIFWRNELLKKHSVFLEVIIKKNIQI